MRKRTCRGVVCCVNELSKSKAISDDDLFFVMIAYFSALRGPPKITRDESIGNSLNTGGNIRII